MLVSKTAIDWPADTSSPSHTADFRRRPVTRHLHLHDGLVGLDLEHRFPAA